MLYKSTDTLRNVLDRTQTVILKSLEIPENLPKNTIKIEPKDGFISVDQIREIRELCTTKQSSPMFFIIMKADLMRPEAQNAFLKLLEEPRENYHFLLLTTQPKALLATILSRAVIMSPKIENALEAAPEADKAIFEEAKHLIQAKTPSDLAEIVEKIGKIKADTRKEYTLSVLETAIEYSYKAYFKTGNTVFVAKIPKFIAAYEGIKKNGNLKLQLFANLI
ncbi:MAG: hypothetical protein Q4E47_01370 [Candidatus Saccharibacteria bacterium]|nr:hypothetical protein [Candidatus Saccharibacteria bacterium]